MTQPCAQDLRETVVRAAASLRAMTADRARARPAAGKWSAQEIIGHLIDSASINHHRFVRARFRDDLEFDSYDQVEWVLAQDYQNAAWTELLDLWEAFNLHLSHVIDRTPDTVLDLPREKHNLDVIAWETVPRDESATLRYLMRDYVAHLEHHLRQIDINLAPEPGRQRRENAIQP
jgi:hypothetical protein